MAPPDNDRDPQSTLNFAQLQVAVAAGKRQFDLIRKKYPDLKACLVLSSPEGQAVINSSRIKILIQFPAMVVDDNAKTRALDLVSRFKILHWQVKRRPEKRPEMQRLKEQLKQIATEFRYDGKCQIELRFDRLDYDLIWKLQSDDLIDQNLTPQTRASIRIVLGTVSHFVSCGNLPQPPSGRGRNNGSS